MSSPIWDALRCTFSKAFESFTFLVQNDVCLITENACADVRRLRHAGTAEVPQFVGVKSNFFHYYQSVFVFKK